MQCPACRAVTEQGPNCRRCKADLSLLFKLEEQRQHALATARQCLREGQWSRAQAIADGGAVLKLDAEAQRGRALASLLRGDFEQAYRYYLAVIAMEGGNRL